MNPLKALLRQVSHELEQTGFGWALVGGLAISSRIEPRFTRDLDLVIAVESDSEAEELIRRFRGADYSVLALVEQEATERLATVRLTAPQSSGLIVDLLFASSGIEREIVLEAERLEIAAGLHVPVARLWHLLAMKLLARDDLNRPQDYVDLCNLLRVASEDDLARARQALRLIEERGFHRKRDLISDLQDLHHSLKLGHERSGDQESTT